MKSKDQRLLEEAYCSMYKKSKRKAKKKVISESHDTESIMKLIRSCVLVDEHDNEQWDFGKDEGNAFTLTARGFDNYGHRARFSKEQLELDGLELVATELTKEGDEETSFSCLPRVIKDTQGNIFKFHGVERDGSAITYKDKNGENHNFWLGDQFMFDGTTLNVVDKDSDAEDQFTIVYDAPRPTDRPGLGKNPPTWHTGEGE